MTEPTPLQAVLLVLGLEDLIPLPEIAGDEGLRGLPAGSATQKHVADALIELWRQGRIQLWSGHWDDDPQPVSADKTEELLRDAEQYRWNSEADLQRRVYFVNVENLRV